MSQKLAVFLSISLTAFVLVIIGAAISLGAQTQAGAINPTVDPQLIAALQTRESAYQALIDQANAQLQQTITASPTSIPTPTTEPTAVYPITPEAAAAIALSAAPNTVLLQTPQLVIFQGAVAYEVALDRGLVYVDATNGRVLYNGTVQNYYTTVPPSSGRDSGEESDD